MYWTLLVAHAAFTTAGYVGLIATNLWLLLLGRQQQASTVVAAVSTWRRSARLFGPVLGIGLLLGFWLASVAGVPLVTPWLIVTYALIVLALGTQAAIMVPWQLRAESIIAQGGQVSVRPIIAVLSVFCFVYVSIVGLMLVRPG